MKTTVFSLRFVILSEIGSLLIKTLIELVLYNAIIQNQPSYFG